MLGLFFAELMKVRRSLIPLVVMAIPLMIFAVLLFGLSHVPEQATWQVVGDGVLNFWVYFLMPLTITLVTALFGQLEHRHNTWSYALTQPQAKMAVFLVKAVTVVLTMGVIAALVLGVTLAAGGLASLINPAGALLGPLPAEAVGRALWRIWLCSMLLTAIQFWVANRFGGMAIPLLFGIGGGLFAVVAAATSFFGFPFFDADYLPWLLPASGMSATPSVRELGYLYGALGGVGAFVVAAFSLARKDWN